MASVATSSRLSPTQGPSQSPTDQPLVSSIPSSPTSVASLFAFATKHARKSSAEQIRSRKTSTTKKPQSTNASPSSFQNDKVPDVPKEPEGSTVSKSTPPLNTSSTMPIKQKPLSSSPSRGPAPASPRLAKIPESHVPALSASQKEIRDAWQFIFKVVSSDDDAIQVDSKAVKDAASLHSKLKDGVMLCQLISKIKKDATLEISREQSEQKQLENIRNFLNAARKYGLSKPELFAPSDLFDGTNMEAVVTTILTIQLYASDVFASSPDPSNDAAETWQQTRERRRRTVDIIGTLDSQGRPDVLIDSIEQKEERRPEKSLQRKSSQPELRPKDTKVSRLLIDKRPQNVRSESDGVLIPLTTPPRRSSPRNVSYHGNENSSPSRSGILQVSEGRPPPFSLSLSPSNISSKSRASPSRGRSESAVDTSLYSSTSRTPSAIRRSSHGSNLSDSPSGSPSRRSADSGKLVFPSSPLIDRRRGSLPLSSALEDDESNLAVGQVSRPHASRRSSSRSSRRGEELLAKLDSYQMSPESKPARVSPNASPNSSVFNQALPRQYKRFNSDAQQIKDDLRDLQPQRTRHDSMTAAGRGLSKPGAKDAVKERLVLNEGGKIAAQYQLGNVCIGKGQFGAVYRALNQDTGQVVAVKRISLEDKADSEIEQLMREVELLKKLQHPSVVHYEGFIKTDGYINIILEYVENGSLLHTLRSFGNFPERLVAKYTVMILEGLSYLHKQDVVHCDLKAANILTTKHANVKLSDFGVSLQLKLVQDMKEDVQGTPNWMAPEIIKLEGASTASDIWSLGCTIIELLTGKPPYADLLAFTAMYRIVQDECPPLPEKASLELKDFLRQCFRKEPTARPSADALFEHAWIAKNWSHKELRPQESVPFLRRLSAEARRSEEAANLASMPSPQASKVSFESPVRPSLRESYSTDSPTHRPYTIDNPESLPPPPPTSPLHFFSRKSIDEDGRPSTAPILGRTFSSPPLTSNLGANGNANNGLSALAHRFVKSSFSKSVECKLCHGSVKKHAVVCEECGLVCHATCAKTYATSWPCNSRLRYHHTSTSSGQGSLDAPLPPGSAVGLSFDDNSQMNLMTPPPTANGLAFPTTHNNLSSSALSSSPGSPTFLSSSPLSSRHGKLIKRTKRDSIQASQNAAHITAVENARANMTTAGSPPSTSGEYNSSIFSASPSRGTLATATSTGTAATSASNNSMETEERRKSNRTSSSDHGHRRNSKSKSRLKSDGDCVIS